MLKKGDQVPLLSSRRSLTDGRTSEEHVLGLTSCADAKAMGWSIEALEEICWKKVSTNRHLESFCLYQRESLLTL